MSRIHPSSENKSGSSRVDDDEHDGTVSKAVLSSPRHTTLTVWKRSSMSFQGTDGFTVYDRRGRLAFRVDNYSRNSHVRSSWSCSAGDSSGAGSGGAVVLMDGSGKPLITLKPQIFSMQNQWNGCIYREEDNRSSKSDMKRIFTMRRPSSSVLVLGRTQNQQAQCEAEVFLTGVANETGGGSTKLSPQPDYRIEGSFWNRNCKIRSTASGKVAAKITRKRTAAAATKITGSSSSNNSSSIISTITLSEEVFSLVVQPGFDPQLIMAFVVILDRICFKPFFPHLMCA